MCGGGGGGGMRVSSNRQVQRTDPFSRPDMPRQVPRPQQDPEDLMEGLRADDLKKKPPPAPSVVDTVKKAIGDFVNIVKNKVAPPAVTTTPPPAAVTRPIPNVN